MLDREYSERLGTWIAKMALTRLLGKTMASGVQIIDQLDIIDSRSRVASRSLIGWSNPITHPSNIPP